MKTNPYKTNPTFTSKFIAASLGRYLDRPDDLSNQSALKRILVWIAQTMTERKAVEKHGESMCEHIAEKIASRLLSNRHLLRNQSLKRAFENDDREGVLRVLFAICATAADQHIREFARRRLADRSGEEITINGSLANGSVPDALAHQPSPVSLEFEIAEIIASLPIDEREIMRAALNGMSQREIAELMGITLTSVNRKIKASLSKSAPEPQI